MEKPVDKNRKILKNILHKSFVLKEHLEYLSEQLKDLEDLDFEPLLDAKENSEKIHERLESFQDEYKHYLWKKEKASSK